MKREAQFGTLTLAHPLRWRVRTTGVEKGGTIRHPDAGASIATQWRVPDVTSGDCECGRGNQTVRHVLLACPMFNDLRREVWNKGTTRPARMDLREILNTPKLARKVASFMIQTRLLGQFGAVLQNEIS